MVCVFAAVARSVRDRRTARSPSARAERAARNRRSRRRRPTGATRRPTSAALRAETLERLKAYEPTATTAATPTGSASATRLPHRRQRRAAGSEQPPVIALERSCSEEVAARATSGPAPLAERVRCGLPGPSEGNSTPNQVRHSRRPRPGPSSVRLRKTLGAGRPETPESLLPPLFRGKSGQGLERAWLGDERRDRGDRQRVEGLENQA